MSNQSKDLAEAFSSHRFRDTYDHLAADVTWVSVGGSITKGKQAVMDVCEGTLRELADTTTEFTRFRSVADQVTAAVDVVGHYVAADGGVSTVASCDVYEFDGSSIVRITSYTVELEADGPS